MRLALAIGPVRHVLLPRTKLDDAGNASLGEVSPTVEESVLRSSHADRAPSDAFPAARHVARDYRLTADYRLRLPTPLPTTDCRMPTTNHQLPTAPYGLYLMDFKS